MPVRLEFVLKRPSGAGPKLDNGSATALRRAPRAWRLRQSRSHTACFKPMTSEDVPSCRTQQHKTHVTEWRVLRYRWHPWFDCNIGIEAARATRGEPVFHCRLGEEASSGRALAIPQWMFDTATCGRMRVAGSPTVSCEALTDLRALLLQWSRRHGEAGVIEASHRILNDQGESDAQSNPCDSRPSSRAAGSASRDRPDTDMAQSTRRGTRANNALVRPSALRALESPTRRRRPRGGR